MPSERPTVQVIAGPNGSGKSSLVAFLRSRGLAFPNHIDPDAIARGFDGPQSGKDIRAQLEADRRRKRYAAERLDFGVETVLSSPKWFTLIESLRASDYRIVSHFVATDDPDINVRRVAQRVACGGHDVAEAIVRARYAASLEHCPRLIALSDACFLFDNSDPEARQPRLCARIMDGTVVDEGNTRAWVRLVIDRFQALQIGP